MRANTKHSLPRSIGPCKPATQLEVCRNACASRPTSCKVSAPLDQGENENVPVGRTEHLLILPLPDRARIVPYLKGSKCL